MPHITVEEGVPGIRSLVLFRPETGKPLYQLAQALLRGPSSIPEAERELIAAYVSSLNNCAFCCMSHAAASRELYGDKREVVDCVIHDGQAEVSKKLRALLQIAAKVAESGKSVLPEHIENARNQGATDMEIHDTVLIAAAFCMYNRYVDGLASFTPTDPEVYREMGVRLAANGYVSPQNSNV